MNHNQKALGIPSDSGFARNALGGVGTDIYRKEMWGIPSRVGVKPFVRDVEDAFPVLDGSLVVGWEENGEPVEIELGPRNLVKAPAGRKHWFRNEGSGSVTVWYDVGSAGAESVKFEAA